MIEVDTTPRNILIALRTLAKDWVSSIVTNICSIITLLKIVSKIYYLIAKIIIIFEQAIFLSMKLS